MLEARGPQAGSLGALSLLCGVVAFALLAVGHSDFRTAPTGAVFAIVAVVAGVVAMRRATGAPGRSAPRWLAGAGIALGSMFVVVVVVVVSAARVPSPNSEAAVLGDIRHLISAQAAYQAASGGYYGHPECLAAPVHCIPGYAANQPTFLDSQLASMAVKTGYRRTFHPLAAETTPAGSVPLPRRPLAAWSYVAVPERPGRTGTRGFCGDNTGRICFTVDGSAPAVQDGLCAPDCQDLR